MKPTTSTTNRHLACLIAASAALFAMPCIHAQEPTSAQQSQNPAPAGEQAAERVAAELDKAAAPTSASGQQLYNVKYEGGLTTDLHYWLRESFPDDNVLMGTLEVATRLPAFELRSVRAEEVARTIEFLSKGFLSVEVLQNGTARRIWHIGARKTEAAVPSMKMRSVAAPHIFAENQKVRELLGAVEEMERERIEAHVMIRGNGQVSTGAEAKPLEEQGVFVIIGDEDGVSGIESLINAVERRCADEAATREASHAASLPKMRVVMAPHVFGKESRWKGLMDEMDEMAKKMMDADEELKKATGSRSSRRVWVRIEPHPTQNVFTLLGSEDAIAGMESMIQCAEKIAADEDEFIMREEARLRAEEEIRAKEEEALKADNERAKAGKRDN